MRRLAAALALATLATPLLAAPASAATEFGLSKFDVTYTNENGSPDFQAGSHPFAMSTSLHFNSQPTGEGGEEAEEQAKDIIVSQIPGFVGAPTSQPTCSTADFLTESQNLNREPKPDCPDAAVIGMVEIQLSSAIGAAPNFSPVYNLVAPPGKAARIGFWADTVPVPIELGIGEEAPHVVIGGPTNISQIIEVLGAKLTLWGVPADHAHDALRGACLKSSGESLGSCPAGTAERPFLTMPRACEGPLRTEYEADSWQHPGVFVHGSVLAHDAGGNPQGMSGCGRLGFSPEVEAQPTVSSAESASGIDFEINVEDANLESPSYEALAEADIAKIQTTLPAGVTANPSAAEGLGFCTEAQYNGEALATAVGAGCPDESKLGSIEATTPLLEGHVLRGSVYLAQPRHNPFGSLFALYIVIRDPERGIFVKLPAKVEPSEEQGSNAGRLITTVEGLPPFPLSHVDLHLNSGPRAPLITPPACGTYAIQTLLTPSSGAPPLMRESTFKVTSGPGGGPCPAGGAPFGPRFEAGTDNNAASAYSPFEMRITRADGEQDLTRFSATLPPGVVGKIAGVAKCPEASIAAASAPGRSGAEELAAPSCPAASRIGSVLAGAGVGPDLTYVPGSLYLAGPYHGDPLSVVAIVPAVAGPFDVGVVVTREALTLNPITAQVQVDATASDPIPHILDGIPLALRELRVSVDRPSFTLNATGCHAERTAAVLGGSGADPFLSADDTSFAAFDRYQAASCASLGFKPKLTLALSGGTKRAQFPAVRSTVTYPYRSGPGYSNIAKAVVTLPPSEFIANAHIDNPCTRVQFNESKCPPGSVLGSAKAISPLLDEPLHGPVYLRANGGARKLPDVVVDLHGLFHVVLVGYIKTIVNHKTHVGRLQTTFANVPDAPVQSFQLHLLGGRRGLLENNANLCAKKRRATAEFTGQNGKRQEVGPLIKTSCGGRQGRGGHGRP